MYVWCHIVPHEWSRQWPAPFQNQTMSSGENVCYLDFLLLCDHTPPHNVQTWSSGESSESILTGSESVIFCVFVATQITLEHHIRWRGAFFWTFCLTSGELFEIWCHWERSISSPQRVTVQISYILHTLHFLLFPVTKPYVFSHLRQTKNKETLSAV